MNPTDKIAADIVSSFTAEAVLSTERLETGNQNYVYAVQTKKSEYVIRLTTPDHKKNFAAAVYWQDKLLPLGVPLAKFIAQDIASPFPALLMNRLPGVDLWKAYPDLTDSQKRALAEKMFSIHQLTRALPDGKRFGYASSYEYSPPHKSWYDFLLHDLNIAAERIRKAALFNEALITDVFAIAKTLEPSLLNVSAQAFMPDTTVKNVIVHEGQLTGIVDVDTMCFGDPLFVLSLTYAGSEVDGLDSQYADYWSNLLKLSLQDMLHLNFYRLLHTVWFMGENSLTAANGTQMNFDIQRLQVMYQTAIARVTQSAQT
jgi:aminoglycoside phosphotransferase (APT) family kinase protein